VEREGKLVEYESYHVWLIIHCRTYPLCSCRLLLFQIPYYALANIWLDRGFVVTCMHSELVNDLIVIKAPACWTRADHHNSELHGLAFRIQSSNWDMHLKSHFPLQFFLPFFFQKPWNDTALFGRAPLWLGLLPRSPTKCFVGWPVFQWKKTKEPEPSQSCHTPPQFVQHWRFVLYSVGLSTLCQSLHCPWRSQEQGLNFAKNICKICIFDYIIFIFLDSPGEILS